MATKTKPVGRWHEKIELNQAIAKANEKFDLSRHEEPVPLEVVEMLCAELVKSTQLSWRATRLRECKTIAELNRMLGYVFDDADRFGVWCGMAF